MTILKSLTRLRNDKKLYHIVISYFKSVLRLIGCSFGIIGYLKTAFLLLLIAEIFGILEEVKEIN